MFQIAYDYKQSWRENEFLSVNIRFAQKVAISSDIARRKANGFLAGYVTMMVSGGQPTLILAKNPLWRVPAVLSLPNMGEVSTLGAVDIDAQTGKIIPPSSEQINRMQELAHAIVAHFASSTAPTG